MDNNQPNINTGTSGVPNPTPVPTPTSTPTSTPTPTPTTTDEPAPKKKRTRLIVGIIVFVVLLLCGGAFAAFAVIKNQPENIAAESFSNLINSQQVAISGTFEFVPDEQYLGSSISPINVTIDSKNANQNQSSNIGLSTKIPATDDDIALDLGEVMLKDGTAFIKASGLKKIYTEVLSSYVDSYLDDAFKRTPNNFSTEIKKFIENTISKVDDKWLKISIQEVLDSDYISQYLDQNTKAYIQKSYDCTIEMKNNMSNYSNEFSDLYSQNNFIKLTPADNSFYKISFDTEKLANYINSLSDTKAVSDYMICSGLTNDGDTRSTVSANDFSSLNAYLPDIYAKFDGFLNHHLTDLKISQNNEYYSMSLNLSFSYPSNLVVSEPSDSTPIMDVVQDIIEEGTVLYQKMYSSSSSL